MALFSKTEREPVLNPVFATRTLACPHCGATVQAAVRAVTLRCPQCAKRLQFEDAVYSRPVSENVSTLGNVSVNRKGALRGTVECCDLLVEGILEGTVQVRGEARIAAKASVAGTLTAKCLQVDSGGRFRGTLCIGDVNETIADAQPAKH